jgi:hypothetical protein
LNNILNRSENKLLGTIGAGITTDADINYFIDALKEIVSNHTEWNKDYIYNPKKNEFEHRSLTSASTDWIQEWFKL